MLVIIPTAVTPNWPTMRGFAAGAKKGTLLAIALTIELLSLGLATAVELRDGGHNKGRAVAIVAGTSLMLLIGASIGTTVL